MPSEKINHYLNITGEICPMTMVRTRLLIDQMKKGEVAEIRLKGEEPIRNVPMSIRELGDEVISNESLNDASNPGEFRLLVRRMRD